MDYSYIFGGIDTGYRDVEMIDHVKQESYTFQVSVDDSQFLSKVESQLSPEIADLVDIAATVAITDRVSFRKNNTRARIHIVLPVRCFERFAHPKVAKCLRKVLSSYTNDHWFFEFRQRISPDRKAIAQLRIPFTEDQSDVPVEVALWSGGLDSLAGLCERLRINPSVNFTLLGTGINTQVFATQRKVADYVKARFSNHIKLVQIPIRFRNLDERVKKNERPNARGFVFTLVGAVCALLEGQDTLYIYENGIGAINLPFSGSAVGLDHLRPVHPLSLWHMSKLVTQILGRNFTYRDPFLYQTKAQMCKSFVDTGTTDLIFHTITCNRRHRLSEEGILQCGVCAACLLRKQALAVQRIIDHTKYVTPAHDTIEKPNNEYLKHVLFQVQNVQSLLETADPWKNISHEYPQLSEIASVIAKRDGITRQDVQHKLISLYADYVKEWDAVKDNVTQTLIP